MKTASLVVCSALLVGLAASSRSLAQAPAGSTGECKDGTYTTAESKRGACAGHGGVKSWFVTDKKSDNEKTEKTTKSSSKKTESESKSAATTAAPAAAAAPATAPPPAKSSTASMSSSRTPPQPAAMAAPGGGAGKVWVNTSSKVYHCQGDEWYGKTKSGEYMSEAQAKSQGAHAAHGKGCS
jgi:hypothetical protein